MVAREWLKRGQSAKPPIDAFTDFWRGLNSLYSAYAGATEVAKIRAFLSARVSSAAAAKMLSSHPQDVTYLLSQPVIDMRGNGRDTAVAIAAFHASDNSQEKLCELFAVIYQVRCNLEHGQKSPNVERDLRLCECSAPMVEAVVAHCL
jgi:hypothetical protein